MIVGFISQDVVQKDPKSLLITALKKSGAGRVALCHGDECRALHRILLPKKQHFRDHIVGIRTAIAEPTICLIMKVGLVVLGVQW